MDDLELAGRIREAAPQVTAPTDLSAHRERILRAARARRSRASRVWTGAAVAALLVGGGGSVALAAGGDETPWGWIADNVFSAQRSDGSFCFGGMQVVPHGVAADSALARDARDIVRSIDLESVDLTPTIEKLRAEYAAATDVHGAPSPLVVSPAQLEQDAAQSYVADILWAELEARGHEMSPGHEVSLHGQTEDCR